MRFNSTSLNDPRIELPPSFPIQVIVEFCPHGIRVESAPPLYSKDPERAAEAIVREKGF